MAPNLSTLFSLRTTSERDFRVSPHYRYGRQAQAGWRRGAGGYSTVIRPLRLTHTDLPAPGHRSIKGAHAHGYGVFDGKTVDLTRVDPSFAGAAGACALVTTVQDLAQFLDALFRGRLFRRRATLSSMLGLAPAQGEGGLVG